MRYFLFFALCLFISVPVFAQGGGKAEPKRVEFATNTSSSSLSEKLSNGEEMEYVFAAVKGQTVTIKNYTKSLFDYKFYNEEHFSEGDFDSSPAYSFVIPESGDYLLFVRKKQVKSPKTARFSISLAIKDAIIRQEN